MSAPLSDILEDRERSGLMAYALILLFFSGFGLLLIAQPPILIRFLGLIYLGSTMVVGLWLYFTRPALYLSYTFWIWFLSPFVRRYIDFATGIYTPGEKAFALLAPLGVSSLMLFDLVTRAKLLSRQPHRPLLLCLLGTVYGLVVGVVLNRPLPALIAFAEWLVPLLMAFYLSVHAHRYPQYRSALQRTFTAAVFVLGVYGVAQYFYPAAWDRMWMVGSEMTSIGRPEPMEVRVFGTLNAPGPYAMALLAGLLVTLSVRSTMGRIAFLPGLMGLLLSMVRAAWGGFFVGLGAAVMRLKGLSRIRLLLVVLFLGATIVPLLNYGGVGSATTERMESMQNIQSDGSFQARQRMYQTILFTALSNPIGYGLGSAHWDSGYVTIFWQLGWLGGALYLIGYLLFARSLLRVDPSDWFATVSFGIAVAFMVLMLLGSQHSGFNGLLQWTFLAMACASIQYGDCTREEALSEEAPDSEEAVLATSY